MIKSLHRTLPRRQLQQRVVASKFGKSLKRQASILASSSSSSSPKYQKMDLSENENTSDIDQDGPIKLMDGRRFASVDAYLKNQPKYEMLQRGIGYFTNKKTIFISVDLEWWERNNKLLTEVGIAIYDPSEQFVIPRIQHEHYIIKEYQSKVNGRFVSNHKFHCSFTKSKLISMHECRKAFGSIIQSYENHAKKLGMNVVYVGHNFEGDLKVLTKNNFYTGDLEVLDTMTMWLANPTATKFAALHKILGYLGISHGLLHNAANDAHYTLLLALSILDPEFRKWKKLDQPIVDNKIYMEKERVNQTSLDCNNASTAMKLFEQSKGQDVSVVKSFEQVYEEELKEEEEKKQRQKLKQLQASKQVYEDENESIVNTEVTIKTAN